MANTTSNIIPMDGQAELISLVNNLNRTITQYSLGLILIMGNIGVVLTCLVFSQATFRKSPCAMYFLASSYAQFFTFNFALVTRMLQYGYDVQAVNMILWYCKVRFYFFYLFVAVPRYNIIMASIDRYFASSRDAHRRQWSSAKIAIRLIIGNIIFWSLMYVQMIFFYEIRDGRCQTQSGVYATFFSIYISFDSGILPLFLMLLFGLLTVKNVHQTKQRIQPGTSLDENRSNKNAKMSKKDVQLHRMLANQIILFVCLNIPNPCYLVYRSITMYTIKSPFRTATETLISNMTYILIYLGFSLTFLNFFVSSKIFRQEFVQLIRTKIFRQTLPTATNGRGTTVRVLRPHDGEE